MGSWQFYDYAENDKYKVNINNIYQFSSHHTENTQSPLDLQSTSGNGFLFQIALQALPELRQKY
jgi:hypothetical protein